MKMLNSKIQSAEKLLEKQKPKFRFFGYNFQQTMRNSFTCQLKACSYSSKTLLQQPQERHLLRSQVYMVGMGLKYVAPCCKSFYC